MSSPNQKNTQTHKTRVFVWCVERVQTKIHGRMHTYNKCQLVGMSIAWMDSRLGVCALIQQHQSDAMRRVEEGRQTTFARHCGCASSNKKSPPKMCSAENCTTPMDKQTSENVIVAAAMHVFVRRASSLLSIQTTTRLLVYSLPKRRAMCVLLVL